PGNAAATLGFMRLGAAGRLAYHRLAGNQAAAAEYRGSLDGLSGARDGKANETRPVPAVDIVRPG
ncbi:MAG: hypothetical protein ACXVRZ_12375, partial [Gaiellaceae bacterium]